MKEHMMTHIKKGNTFECPITACNSKFNSFTSLQFHVDSEHIIRGSSPAKCKSCIKWFNSSHRLLLHFHTAHLDHTPLHSTVSQAPLPQCSRSVKSAKELSPTPSTEIETPEEEELDGPESWYCDYCKIRFDDKVMWYLHSGLHSDDIPFKCSLCGSLCDGKYDFAAHLVYANHNF
ncbi:Zinc finger protein ehn-3 [Caenorhabditis elegans]|uniref:Isoform c of Zinc finger protein ehn-3 n=1 Tax=Caenorhabditis elegans TaxID=6239 RepID=Q65XX7-3|nr:Zinc finger protein ehn-3 [Caenorhabditis elegans]CCD71118.1 Zinc finger protein ehn-3 [Caenorhabditis elegans]|eukprot:NP_001023617.1 Enhancer of HAND mutation hnd-1 [Caenorhabditis elegans]